MKKIILFLLLAASFAAHGQYGSNPNKIRLGNQTSGDGLVYRTDSIPDYTPSSVNNAWVAIDTLTGTIYYYKAGWQSFTGGTQIDSLTFAVDTLRLYTPDTTFYVVIGLNNYYEIDLGPDTIVPYPDSFPFRPFEIFRNGTDYYINPNFSLRERANVHVVRTYYVDYATGNDANDGLSWSTPLKSVYTAVNKTDVDRIYIAKGRYPFQYSIRNATIDRDIEILPDYDHGTGDSVWLTRDMYDRLTTSWTADGNLYYARYTRADTFDFASDWDTLDVYGDPVRFTARANKTDVNNNPGSYWSNGDTIFIRTFDSRIPDSLVVLSGKNINVSSTQISGAVSIYMKGINFISNGFYGNAALGAKIYIDSCRFLYSPIYLNGHSESMIFNSRFSNASADLINYDPEGAFIPNSAEYNLNMYNSTGDAVCTNCQASTAHNGCVTLRVNGSYGYTNGQNIADVNTSKTFMLGVNMYAAQPASSAGFYTSGTGTTAWLENCTSTQSTGKYDLQNSSNNIISSRFFTGSEGNDIQGSLVTYAPDESYANKVSELPSSFTYTDNDKILLVKESDGDYYSTAIGKTDLANSLGFLESNGSTVGAIDSIQRFAKGISVNSETGASVAVKATSTSIPALRYNSLSGQTSNIVEGYLAGTLRYAINSSGYFRFGDISGAPSDCQFSAIWPSGNPSAAFGGKVIGQQGVIRLYGGTTFYSLGYQSNAQSGDFLIRYNSESGGAGLRISNSGKVGIGNLTATPGAMLDILASSGAAGTAPIKLRNSQLLATPEIGTFEYYNQLDSGLYFTPSVSQGRMKIAQINTSINPSYVSVMGSNNNIYRVAWSQAADSILKTGSVTTAKLATGAVSGAAYGTVYYVPVDSINYDATTDLATYSEIHYYMYVGAGATANQVLTVPAASSTYAGKKIYVVCDDADQTDAYGLAVTSSSGATIRYYSGGDTGFSDNATYGAFGHGEGPNAVLFVCVQNPRTLAYRWVAYDGVRNGY